MNGNEIVDAVEKLHAKYPLERVELWVGYGEDGREHVTARVGAGGDMTPIVWGYGDGPMAAALDAIKKAGERDPVALADAKIAKLRKELAELEAKQPVVMEA